MTLTSRQLLYSLEFYHEVTSERIITEYLKQRKILAGGLRFLQLHRRRKKDSGIDGIRTDRSDFHLQLSE